MLPIIKSGCQLFVNINPKQNYQIGDIVIFLGKKRALNAHRIIKIRKSLFTLKGDNNLGIDGSFEANQLFGKVEKIIYPKYIINLNSHKNRLTKYFFTLYSYLNLKFPSLLKVKELYKIPLFKSFYRLLLRSTPENKKHIETKKIT